jgi:hypothetical protein
VICEIMNDDGTMARMPELEVFAKPSTACRIVSIADLIQYRLLTSGWWKLDARARPRAPGERAGRRAPSVRRRQTAGKLPMRACASIEAAGRGVVVFISRSPRPDLHDELSARIAGRQRPKRRSSRAAPSACSTTCGSSASAPRVLLDQGVRQGEASSPPAAQRIKGVEGYGIEVVDQIVIPPRARGHHFSQTTCDRCLPGEGSLS